MSLVRLATASALSLAVLTLVPTHVRAASPSGCTSRDAFGYCVEWSESRSRNPSPRRRSAPSCYWARAEPDVGAWDASVFALYGLQLPPLDVEVYWQGWTCDGGSPTDYRWLVAVTPEALAQTARGRLVGTLPAPAVLASPPIGTAAIVGVPVFVSVDNWTGVVSDSECAGSLCVTVQARPELVFEPGEAGSAVIACDGSGSTYRPGSGSPVAQAAVPGACAHAYAARTGTVGRPAEWPGEVSVTWSISWSASSGASGSLPSVTRSAAVPRAVAEVQTVIAGGDTP